MPEISRRRFLAGLGAAAAGAAVGGGGGLGAQKVADASGADVIPFYGRYQSGITTRQQDRLCFAAFDFVTDDKDAIVDMFKKWTVASATMVEGKPTGSVAGSQWAPPDD